MSNFYSVNGSCARPWAPYALKTKLTVYNIDGNSANELDFKKCYSSNTICASRTVRYSCGHTVHIFRCPSQQHPSPWAFELFDWLIQIPSPPKKPNAWCMHGGDRDMVLSCWEHN